MHFLLIPYTLLSALFVMHYQVRSEMASRGGLVVTSIAAGTLLFLAMLFRPAAGDSWRYYRHFLELRDLSLVEALQHHASDPLFTLLNWVAGQFGLHCSQCLLGQRWWCSSRYSCWH